MDEIILLYLNTGTLLVFGLAELNKY